MVRREPNSWGEVAWWLVQVIGQTGFRTRQENHMTISTRVGAVIAPMKTIFSMINLAKRSVSFALSSIVSCPRNSICVAASLIVTFSEVHVSMLLPCWNPMTRDFGINPTQERFFIHGVGVAASIVKFEVCGCPCPGHSKFNTVRMIDVLYCQETHTIESQNFRSPFSLKSMSP